MTHAAVHSPSSHPSSTARFHQRTSGAGLVARLSGERIAASTGAITLHAAVFLLLLAPMAAPQLLPKISSQTEAIWIPRDPPPRVEPIPVPVSTQPAVAKTTTPVRLQPVAPSVVVATAEPGDIAVPAEGVVIERGTPGPPASISAPQTGALLQYAQAPPPAYPREAVRYGQRGVVLLQVLVDTDGKPLQVDVAQSSGHRSLDRAAQRHVLARWTFHPALQDGRPVQAIGLVPVEFALQ